MVFKIYREILLYWLPGGSPI